MNGICGLWKLSLLETNEIIFSHINCTSRFYEMKYKVFSASGFPFDVDLAAEGLLTELNVSRKPIYSAGCKPFDLSSRIWKINECMNILVFVKNCKKQRLLEFYSP